MPTKTALRDDIPPQAQVTIITHMLRKAVFGKGGEDFFFCFFDSQGQVADHFLSSGMTAARLKQIADFTYTEADKRNGKPIRRSNDARQEPRIRGPGDEGREEDVEQEQEV